MWNRAFSIALLGCSFVGCASFANTKRNAVSSRATFDLSCPADRLQVTALSDENMERETYGVAGCGKKASYVYAPGAGAVLNSPIETSAAAADSAKAN